MNFLDISGPSFTDSIGLADYQQNLGLLTGVNKNLKASGQNNMADLEKAGSSFESLLLNIILKSIQSIFVSCLFYQLHD